MARKKKYTKSTRHRRRRLSGIGQSLDFTGMALAVGGAIVANGLKGMLTKSTNATANKAAPYAGVIAGVLVQLLVKNPMAKAASIGMIAASGLDAAKASGIISGLDMNTIHGSLNQYRQLPYRKAMNGIGDGPTKSNFTGSRLSQMHTIAGLSKSGAADGSGAGG
jgi:hypothetical protein